MDQPAFSGLLLVVSVAFAAPFLLGFFPSVRLPAVVLEIVAGIVIGPAVTGWVEIDATIAGLPLHTSARSQGIRPVGRASG